MPDGPIAKAYVEIHPDLSRFRDELRAGLDEQMDSLGARTVRIDADTLEADRKISDTSTRVDELGARTPSPTVHVNDTDAKAALDYMQARIDRLSSEAATVKIGTTGSARTGIGDVQSALDQLRNETLTPRVDMSRLTDMSTELDNLETKLHNVDSDMGNVSRSAATAGEGVGGLASAALAASPALVTVGAVGAAGLGAIAIGSAAALTGLGALALALGGSKGLKTQVAEATTSFQAMTVSMTDPLIAQTGPTLHALFNDLLPVVNGASGAVVNLEQHAQAALTAPFWREFFGYLGGEASSQITAFGGLFGGLGHLFAGVTEGAAPLLARMDTDVARWSQDLSRWGNDAANGGLNKFISYVEANGPLLAHTFENIASDVGVLIKDTAPLGPMYLNVLDVVARLLGDLERLNPTLVAWAVGIGSVAYSVNRLLGPLGGLKGAAGDLKTVFADLANFTKIANGAASAEGAVGGLAVSLGNAARGGLSAADAGAGVTVGLGAMLGPLAIAGASVAALGVTYEILASKEHAAMAADQAAAQSFVNGFISRAQAAGDTRAQIESLISAQAKQIEIQEYMTGSTARQTDEVQMLNAALKSMQGEDAGAAAATQAVGSATGNLTASASQLTSQLQAANTALSQTETLLNNLLGQELSAAQSTDSFYAAVQSLTTSLHTNGTSMDAATAKGLANKQALDGVGSSILGVVSSMEKQGATSDQIVGKVQSLTSYLEAQAGKYGLTTAQVDDYLQQLGLTPAQVKTDIQLSGYDAASQKVQTITNEINSIPKTATTILQIEQTFGGQGVSGTNALARSGYATGTPAAPGGLATVAERGPELMASRGSLTMFMTPQVADIPAGAQVFTASQTAKMAHYADGVGNTAGLASIEGVTFNVPVKVPPPVTFAPTYLLQVDGAPSPQTLEQIKALLAAHDQEMVHTIGQMTGAHG